MLDLQGKINDGDGTFSDNPTQVVSDASLAAAMVPSDKNDPDIERASKPLERISVDIWGPCRVPSAGGAVYFATAVDDFSRFIEIFPLKRKSKAFHAIQTFINKWENQLDLKVKIIRSDGGAEFGAGVNGSLEAKAFWREKGIIHSIVPPGNHAQNGRVEHPHLTILQSTQTFLIDSGLPGIFWAEAALYGVHVYNRLPNSSNIIPQRLFTGEEFKPALFHAFGGKCWFRDNDNQSKLAPRYKDGKFINYIDESDTPSKSGTSLRGSVGL